MKGKIGVTFKLTVPELEAEARSARLRGESWATFWERARRDVWAWARGGKDWRRIHGNLIRIYEVSRGD